ncbi:MAG: FG-GAP-like repeat-containing protein [Planctomycetota bacterium]
MSVLPSKWKIRTLALIALVGFVAMTSSSCLRKSRRSMNVLPFGPACTAIPSALSYLVEDAIYVIGIEIPPNILTFTHDCANATITVEPELPPGLSLGTDGTISGTPTELTDSKEDVEFTVTVTNENGSASITIYIVIVEAPPVEPVGLEYPFDTYVFLVNAPIDPLVPTLLVPTAELFEIAPFLSPGLVINPATGVISGTPTVIADEIVYTVIASNKSGSATTMLRITVIDVPRLAGPARYLDQNRDGIAGMGDQLILTFDQPILVSGSAGPADLLLPVAGDALGAGSTLSAGANAQELRVVLGTNPSLKSRQQFASATIGSNAASGVDVDLSAPDRIESALTGADAMSTGVVDVVPGFVLAQTLAVASDAAIGDFDRDGDADVVTISSASTQYFANNGAGLLSASGPSFVVSGALAISAGDLDLDGDQDLAIGTDEGIDVWSGNGQGGFGLVQQLGSAVTRGLVLADLDRDGDLDLVGANEDVASEIWLNNGSGSFAASSSAQLASSLGSAAVGDFDGDGDFDLVLDGRLYLQASGGGFGPSATLLTTLPVRALAAFDVERDGDLDLYYGLDGSADLLFLNNGSGVFSAGSLSFSLESTSLLAMDIGSDGRTDLVAAGLDAGGDSRTRVLVNDGSTLAAAVLVTDSALALHGAVDLNRDGDLDLVSSAAGSLVTHANSLAGTWGTASLVLAPSTIPAASTYELATGDLNGDDRLDIVTAEFGSATTGAPNRVLIGDGLGGFAATAQLLGNDLSEAIALLDADRDGDLDIFAGNSNAPNRLYLNNGAGMFADSGLSLPGTQTASLAVGDLNADGNADVMVGNRGPNHVLFSNGAGGFVTSTQLVGNGWSYAVALGDFDCDGDLDLIDGTSVGRQNKLWLNDSNGIFTDSLVFLGVGEVRDLATGDIDGDGDLDVIAGQTGAGPFPFASAIWLGDGTGQFSEVIGALPEVTVTMNVELADIDGDGDLDLVVGNVGTNRLYLNDGTGQYTVTTTDLGSGEGYGLAIGDFDRDGDIDVVVGNGGGASDRIYLNR